MGISEWAAIIAAVTGIVLVGQWAVDRANTARMAGIRPAGTIRFDMAKVALIKVGDAPYFDVEISLFAGEAGPWTGMPRHFPEVTRETKLPHIILDPDERGCMAVKVSYQTRFEAGRRTSYVWDVVGQKKLKLNASTMKRLARIEYDARESVVLPPESDTPKSQSEPLP